MNNLFQRSRHVWRGWRSWPPFALLVWIMLLWWLVDLANQRLAMMSWRNFSETTVNWLSFVHGTLAYPINVIPVLLTAAVPLLIVWRVKRQMADWRSTLIPEFRRAHLMVASLIAVGIFLFMVCAPKGLDLFLQRNRYLWQDYFISSRLRWGERYGFWYWSFWPTMGDLAWLSFTAILAGWIMVSFSPWLAATIVLSCWMFRVGLGWGMHAYYWLNTYALQDPVSIVLFFALDLLLFFSLFLRLSHITSGRESISADERVPWLNTLLTGQKMSGTGLLMQAGLWQRARHRRLLGLGHRFIWIIAIYLAAINAFSPLVAGVYPKWMEHNGYAFSAVQLAAIISALTIGLSWPQRIIALGEVELLRPAEREAFAGEIGLAMLADAVEICVATLLAMLVPIAIWTPDAFASAGFWMALIAAILSQAMIFGIIVWTMLRGTVVLSMTALCVATLGGIMLINKAWDDRQLIPSLCAAAIGIALALHAYRRWQHVDAL